MRMVHYRTKIQSHNTWVWLFLVMLKEFESLPLSMRMNCPEYFASQRPIPHHYRIIRRPTWHRATLTKNPFQQNKSCYTIVLSAYADFLWKMWRAHIIYYRAPSPKSIRTNSSAFMHSNIWQEMLLKTVIWEYDTILSDDLIIATPIEMQTGPPAKKLATQGPVLICTTQTWCNSGML